MAMQSRHETQLRSVVTDDWTNWKTLYAFYPRGVETGGPEALHQLVDMVRRTGREAFLVPIPGTEENPDVEAYSIYDAPIANRAPDDDSVIIVAPEATIGLLKNYRSATTVIWWLSIDFSSRFFLQRTRERDGLFSKSFLGNSARRAFSRSEFALARRYDPIIKRSINLAQSRYAWSFLFARLGIVSSILSDYTSQATIDLSQSVPEGTRGLRVAYSPRRGGKAISALRASRPDLQWVAIEGMSKRQVVETLKDVAVYVDLGHHPGKDRMPREAALCGAVVVVARAGSAAVTDDVPLPWHHKVRSQGDLIAGASATLDLVLADVDLARSEQLSYVDWIRGEKLRFAREIEEVFLAGRLDFDITGFDAT